MHHYQIKSEREQDIRGEMEGRDGKWEVEEDNGGRVMTKTNSCGAYIPPSFSSPLLSSLSSLDDHCSSIQQLADLLCFLQFQYFPTESHWRKLLLMISTVCIAPIFSIQTPPSNIESPVSVQTSLQCMSCQ